MPATPNPEAIGLHDEVARAVRMRDDVAARDAMRPIIDEAAKAVAPESTAAQDPPQPRGA